MSGGFDYTVELREAREAWDRRLVRAAKAYREDVARRILADARAMVHPAVVWPRMRDAMAYRARLQELVKRSQLEGWARLYGMTPRWSEDTPTLRRRVLATMAAIGAQSKARARRRRELGLPGIPGMPRVTRRPGG